MQITGLTQTSAEHITVSFSDGSETRSTLGAVTDLRLFRGKELDEKELDEFRLRSQQALWLERAIEYISRRPMSEAEMLKKLQEKGADKDAAEYCVQRCTELGFIDEERYAASVVRHYSRKGFGAGRIRMELSRRGIPRDLWEDALEEMEDTDDRMDSYLRSHLKDPDNREQVRKVSAALSRRGFGWDEIREALARFADGTDEEYFEYDP